MHSRTHACTRARTHAHTHARTPELSFGILVSSEPQRVTSGRPSESRMDGWLQEGKKEGIKLRRRRRRRKKEKKKKMWGGGGGGGVDFFF